MGLSASEVARTWTALMPQSMNVWTENTGTGPTGGRFDVLALSGVACRIFATTIGRGEPIRAEDLAHRQVNWDAAQPLPSHNVQLEIDGERWQPVPGTIRARRGIAGEVWMWSCLVTGVGT